MDKEQAIELLEHLAWDRDIDRNLYGEALNMAIDALKAQLSMEDATSDTISRQQAIDALDFEIVHITAYCDGKNVGNPLAQYNKGLEDGKKAIEALPPAQPELKEGHWIEGGIYRDVIECYCSECGQLMTTAVTVRMNFCPNCGAKMKGERQK